MRHALGRSGCDILRRSLILLTPLRPPLHFLFVITFMDVLSQLGCGADGANDMLHVVGLAIDQGAKMQNDTLGFVALSLKSLVGVLHGSDLLSVALALPLELLSNLLLQNEGFESIVALLLGTRQTESKTSSIILLLVDETGETTVLASCGFDLDRAQSIPW